MKKVIIGLAVFFLVLNAAHAGTRENCGCGLGSMVIGDQDGLLSQGTAGVINGCFGNQTFGITFGTLGCERATDLGKRNEKLDIFIAENMDNLAVDIASGQGETLGAMAELIEVSGEKRTKLFAALQNNFEKIYPSADVSHADVTEKIITIVEQI